MRPADTSVEVIVIGSGAGGALTAALLAEAGRSVLLLEEGAYVDTGGLASNTTQAMRTLYRNGGMTPILGKRKIGFVEGCCVGGSTEINSAFWHRIPEGAYYRWKADALLADFEPAQMDRYFERIERDLSVSTARGPVPPSSEVLRLGAERLGWACAEVPRCQSHDLAGSAYAPGAKQSMQRTYLPRALAAGARLLAGCKAVRLRHEAGRVRGLDVEVVEGGRARKLALRAEHYFVCGGAIQTPALLRRSGIRRNVGSNLCIHPMIKVAAVFDHAVSSIESALPVYQVKEFGPNITLGGAVFTPGFLAMTLASRWAEHGARMAQWEQTALYYAATRGMKRGTVRVVPGSRDGVVVRYPLSEADRRNLSLGLARLCEVLFAGGARAILPGVTTHSVLTQPSQAEDFSEGRVPLSAMDLSTVHVFSTCPMGENPDYCATDSYGRVTGFENLHVNDASLIPDSPGVNPQGTTMAIALRNVEHFLES